MIALAPDNANLYVARGRAYAKDNRWSQAFRDFSKAVELAPDNVRALTGRASQNLDRKRADLAMEDLNRAITLDPKAAEAYFWRGQARYSVGDAQTAEADLSQAIEVDPSFADAYRIRGNYGERAGKRDDAIADYRRAVELDPFSREARDAYKAASGDTADSIVKPMAQAVDGWEVFRSASGQYTALNERYSKTPVLLEVQGNGPVQIVEWTPLKESLWGSGFSATARVKKRNTSSSSTCRADRRSALNPTFWAMRNRNGLGRKTPSRLPTRTACRAITSLEKRRRRERRSLAGMTIRSRSSEAADAAAAEAVRASSARSFSDGCNSLLSERRGSPTRGWPPANYRPGEHANLEGSHGALMHVLSHPRIIRTSPANVAVAPGIVPVACGTRRASAHRRC